MIYRLMLGQKRRIQQFKFARRTLVIFILAGMFAQHMMRQELGRFKPAGALHARMWFAVLMFGSNVFGSFRFIGKGLFARRTGERTFVGVSAPEVQFHLGQRDEFGFADL